MDDCVLLQLSQEVAACGSSGLQSFEAMNYTLFTDIAQLRVRCNVIFNDVISYK